MTLARASTLLQRHPVALHGPIGQWAAPLPGLLTAVVPEEFVGEGTRTELGDITLARLHLSPCRYSLRTGMQDVVDMVYLRSGTVDAESPNGRRRAPRHGLVLARPTRGDRVEISTDADLLWVSVPVSAVRPELLPRQDLPLLRVPAGMGGPFAGFVDGLLDGPERCTAATARSLHAALIGIVEAVLQEAKATRRDTEGSTLLERARRYIDSEFADPTLSPATIAAALGVAVRTLHLAFEQEPQTVARSIETHRLAAVEEALAAGSDATVASLARRFGYLRADQLSRSYRRVYGRTIHDARRSTHLDGGA